MTTPPPQLFRVTAVRAPLAPSPRALPENGNAPLVCIGLHDLYGDLLLLSQHAVEYAKRHKTTAVRVPAETLVTLTEKVSLLHKQMCAYTRGLETLDSSQGSFAKG